MTTKKNRPDKSAGVSLTLETPKERGQDKTPRQKASALSVDNEQELIYGVFSSEVSSMVGTGATKRKGTKQALWFVEEVTPESGGERIIQIRKLNSSNVPSGEKRTLPLSEFLQDYTPELEYYQTTVYPKMKELDNLLDRSEEQRNKGAYYSAQFGFEAALEFDEQNVRANFGLGLTYMARGDMDKAADIFKRVVVLDAAFSPEHKHLFNEFGINLRKSRLYDQAIEYYTRALEMTDDDENLYYNIARALFEHGDRDQCRENLEKALELNPGFEAAAEFLAHLKQIRTKASPDVSLD